MLIPSLTELEFASALARWTRPGELDEPQANRIESAFYEDRGAGRFHRTELAGAHYEGADHWLLARKSALHTLDALHLAAAEGSDAMLITLGEALLQAARWLGVRAELPCPAPLPLAPWRLP